VADVVLIKFFNTIVILLQDLAERVVKELVYPLLPFQIFERRFISIKKIITLLSSLTCSSRRGINLNPELKTK
jgi:hypothetical protein